jgi:hypothetical protein
MLTRRCVVAITAAPTLAFRTSLISLAHRRCYPNESVDHLPFFPSQESADGLFREEVLTTDEVSSGNAGVFKAGVRLRNQPGGKPPRSESEVLPLRVPDPLP